MTFSDHPFLQCFLHFCGNCKSLNLLAMVDCPFPNFCAQAFLCQLVNLHQPLICMCFFNGCQFLTLQIFNEGSRRRLMIIHLPNHCRNPVQPQFFYRTQSAFACNQLITAFGAAHHDRLNNPVHTDGLAQFINSFLIKNRAGLIGTGFNFIYGNLHDLIRMNLLFLFFLFQTE